MSGGNHIGSEGPPFAAGDDVAVSVGAHSLTRVGECFRLVRGTDVEQPRTPTRRPCFDADLIAAAYAASRVARGLRPRGAL